MKQLIIHRKTYFALAFVIALLGACMYIDEIIIPDNIKVNTDIEISVTCRVVPETDDKSNFMFAVLVPKSWNFSQNAELFLSTTDYSLQGGADVVDEKMTLASSEVEPSTAMPWSQAYQSKKGLLGNTGPVEWVVFKSQTMFIINDKISTAPIYAKVKIKVKTGAKNIKFFMGFEMCGSNWGISDDGEARYKENIQTRVVTVTGGAGIIDDYTILKLVSTTPATFRYGDIFAVEFVSQIGTTTTALTGEKKVYLCSEATLDDGSVLTLDTISESTLMDMVDETSYRKYIYPRSFFNVPAGKAITDIKVWFVNSDKTRTVDSDGNKYTLTQSEN